MDTPTSNPPEPHGHFVSTDPELAAIDASVRWPVLACFLTSVHWLVVGTVLLVYASALTHPQDALAFPFGIPSPFVFLNHLSAEFGPLTYGRVWPAAVDTLVYGWGLTAGLGIAIWVLTRTSRAPLRSPGAVMTGVIFWNLGVAIGLTGLFLGYGNSVELLEFPACAACVLWIAYALISLWCILTYLGRKPGAEHLSQGWILVALLAFPWLYGGGSILLSSTPPPGSGVIQGLLDAWYVHCFYTLALAPLGLGLLYYLVPKVAGVGIRFGDRTKLAFWVWLVCAPWTAVHDLVGGPFPADTVTVGLILSGLIFIPVAIIGLNLVPTALEGEERHHGGIVLPFLILAAGMFVFAGISEELLSIRSANELLRFTLFRETNFLLWIYGFFSFVIFGSIYYIVPRLIDFGWRSSILVRVHYYASVYGILLVIALLGFGGVMQGMTLEDPNPAVTVSTASQIALSFHIATTMCVALVAIGNGVFAWQLGWTFLAWLYRQVRGNRLMADVLLEPYNAPEVAPTAARLEARR
jgi:cytochrome c oxidase cbb3-type subunit 1